MRRCLIYLSILSIGVLLGCGRNGKTNVPAGLDTGGQDKNESRTGGQVGLELPKDTIATESETQDANANRPSETEITNSIGMKLKLIPAGEFLMGSPADEADRYDNEGPQHKVRITKPFYIGMTEVTQGQWVSVMGTKPWDGKEYVQEGDDYPAVYVSWDDAVAYCEKLNTKESKSYRLPTEAEWEYACRGGTDAAYSFGASSGSLADYAWFSENAGDISEKYAHTVGTKKQNPLGLHDMHGNVWEWCADAYDAAYYASSPANDPPGAMSSDRVLRGGSWSSGAAYCRSAGRNAYEPTYRANSNGFRLALSPSGK